MPWTVFHLAFIYCRVYTVPCGVLYFALYSIIRCFVQYYTKPCTVFYSSLCSILPSLLRYITIRCKHCTVPCTVFSMTIPTWDLAGLSLPCLTRGGDTTSSGRRSRRGREQGGTREVVLATRVPSVNKNRLLPRKANDSLNDRCMRSKNWAFSCYICTCIFITGLQRN
jgi:hypothetical protein